MQCKWPFSIFHMLYSIEQLGTKNEEKGLTNRLMIVFAWFVATHYLFLIDMAKIRFERGDYVYEKIRRSSHRASALKQLLLGGNKENSCVSDSWNGWFFEMVGGLDVDDDGTWHTGRGGAATNEGLFFHFMHVVVPSLSNHTLTHSLAQCTLVVVAVNAWARTNSDIEDGVGSADCLDYLYFREILASFHLNQTKEEPPDRLFDTFTLIIGITRA